MISASLEAALAAVGELSPPPTDLVLALAADPAPRVRAAAVAELSHWGDDPNTVVETELEPEQLAALAECRLAWIRAGVAAHPSTDRLTLDRLAADPDPLVVQALAARLDLPAELATALVSHPEPVVRAELGRNPTAAFLLATPALAATQVAPPGDAVPAAAPAPTHHAAAVAVMEPPTHGPSARGDPPEDTDSPARSDAPPHRGRRWLAGGIAAGLLLLGGTATVWRSADATPPTTPASSASSTVAWHGTWLPVGPDGPSTPSAATAAGFARTELGAAMAAAHLSVRIDPYAGPDSFRPTITTQTYGGDPARLLARTDAAYRAAANNARITAGAPIPTSTGQVVGWRTDHWTPEGPTTVHLLVQTPDGDRIDFAIAVTWIDGDYRLVDPTRAGTFVTTEHPDPSAYTTF